MSPNRWEHLRPRGDRERQSLAVPSLTALPISAASWNNCLRDVFVTNCDRSSMCSSQTDPRTTYTKDWTSSNKRPLAQEHFWRQPAKMLDAQPLRMSVRCRLEDISVICVSTSPKPKSRAGNRLPPAAESEDVLWCCHRISACPRENGSQNDAPCGPTRCPPLSQHVLWALSYPWAESPTYLQTWHSIERCVLRPTHGEATRGVQDGDSSAPLQFFLPKKKDQKLQKWLSWYGQLDKSSVWWSNQKIPRHCRGGLRCLWTRAGRGR